MTLMTTPPLIETPPRHIPTGNLYVSLPSISRDDAAVYHLGVLHMGANALLEFVGSEADGQPLLRPVIERSGQRVPLIDLEWSRESFWLPRFRAERGGLRVTGTIFAPPGEKGFVYLLEVSAEGGSESIHAGVEGWWYGLESVAFRAKQVAVERVIWRDAWTGSLVGEARAGLPLLAWGLQAAQEGDLAFDGSHYRWTSKVTAGSGQTARVAFYFSVNLESDGARTTALHLRRRGWQSMLDETRRWLESRAIQAKDADLARVLNTNLFFNYFFAQGDCLDSEEIALVTSRSRNYYVSAAFWARDAFLWNFPAMLIVDRARARRALLAGLTRYLRWGGHHALYINGALLYPGFELDEACAPAIALDRYLRTTGDLTLLDQSEVRIALPVLLDTIAERFDRTVGLYSTFLSPHDDPVTYPFLTYNNVLVWRTLCILAEVYARIGATSRAADLNTQATSLRETILAKCVVEGPYGEQFAWAVDGAGGFELDDQPGGSLTLLPYYGFCASDDPVYRNTVRWIYSAYNPYFFAGAFGGTGSAHFHFPCVFDLANRLLRGDENALNIARRAPLDQGLACESFDAQTGVVRTGAAFASGAGLLAFALNECV
ncbi:MAG: glycoside hydrolase family 125 protein [Chloroflexota bacterium]